MRAHAGPARARAWAVTIPPLYTVTVAVVGGDAIGNIIGNASGNVSGDGQRVIPLWIAIGLALAAAALFIGGRPLVAAVIAIGALGTGATIPVGQLLNPPHGLDSLYRFDDGGIVTLEGWLIREPEAAGNQRTCLYVAAERAGPAAGAMTNGGPSPLEPIQGAVRVTILNGQHWVIGDEVRVTGALRFPRNDGDPSELDYRAWTLRQGIVAAVFAEPRKRQRAPPYRFDWPSRGLSRGGDSADPRTDRRVYRRESRMAGAGRDACADYRRPQWNR